MPDYVTLMGAEEVSRAASTMREAAHNMERAASTISEALQRHERMMEEFVVRMEALVTDATETGGEG